MSLRFLHPELAIWLSLLPAAALLWWLHYRHQQGFRRRAGFGPDLRRLSRLSPGRQEAAVLAAAILAAGGIVLAAMQPQLLFEQRRPQYLQQDLVLMLDRSASMLAEDVPPSRFGRAIEEIKRFLADKPEAIDRVGLVGFAGSAVPLSYLTRDLDALYFFLDWIGEDPELYFGTDIAGALDTALTLTEGLEPAATLYMLLSDGDDPNAALPSRLDELGREGVRVHSIGIGSDREVPIPVGRLDGEVQYLTDNAGQPVTTSFDPATLRRVASMTGGSYFRSGTGGDMAGFMHEVAQRERRRVGWQYRTEHHDIHGPLLLLAGAATFLLFLKA